MQASGIKRTASNAQLAESPRNNPNLQTHLQTIAQLTLGSSQDTPSIVPSQTHCLPPFHPDTPTGFYNRIYQQLKIQLEYQLQPTKHLDSNQEILKKLAEKYFDHTELINIFINHPPEKIPEILVLLEQKADELLSKNFGHKHLASIASFHSPEETQLIFKTLREQSDFFIEQGFESKHLFTLALFLSSNSLSAALKTIKHHWDFLCHSRQLNHDEIINRICAPGHASLSSRLGLP